MEQKKAHEEWRPLRGWLHVAGTFACMMLMKYLLVSGLLERLFTGQAKGNNGWFIFLDVVVATTIGFGGSWLLYHWLSKYLWFQKLDNNELLAKVTIWIAYSGLAGLLVLWMWESVR